MPTWKKILLRSAGFGAGFAVVVCAVIGGFIWYSNRPKQPKPWNKQAITAEYDYVRPEGDKNNLVFRYILQNNTDFDYRVDSDTSIAITGKLKQEKGYSDFGGPFGRYVTTEYPILVPAKSRVRIAINIPYAYPTKEKDKETSEERQQFSASVAKYVTGKFTNLDGFVLLDTSNRYEIDFPTGWEKETAVAK